MESSPAVGAQLDVSMKSAGFQIDIQSSSWKMAVSSSELCRMSKIPMGLLSFTLEN
jgi:hypothetical protein